MRNNRSKPNLMLLEIIIATLFFTLSAAACVRIFAGARELSRNSENLSSASIRAAEVAEIYQNLNGDFSKLVLRYNIDENDGEYNIYYDSDWNITTSDKASFRIHLIEKEQTIDKLNGIQIIVYDFGGEHIYSLTTNCYLGGGV